MSWRQRVVPQRAGLLLAGGALMGLAHPPFHLLVTSFVALVPYIVWLERLPPGPEGRRQARIGGFLFGLIYYTLVLYWLFVALVFYTWLAVVAFLGPILIMALILSWATAAMHLARHRLRWPLWVVVPVFWTAAETLRAHLPDIAFPWMQLGDSLSGFPFLVGAADLVGSRGLSFWLVAANVLVALGILSLRPPVDRQAGAAADVGTETGAGPAIGVYGGAVRWRRVAGLGVALGFTLAGPIVYSLVRWQTLEMRPVARVGVVQPNVPQHLRETDSFAATDSALRATQTLIAPWLPSGSSAAFPPESAGGAGDGLAEAGEDSTADGPAGVPGGATGGSTGVPGGAADGLAGVRGGAGDGRRGERMDLALFPETMFRGAIINPMPSFPYDGWAEAQSWGEGLARALGAEVAVGGIGADHLGGERFQLFNSSFHFRAGEGLVNRYDKRRLVPLVERVPFLPPRWFERFPYMGNFGVGALQPPVQIATESGTAAYGTLICYESIFSPLARHYRRAGADFLVNISNDSWFGRDAWWSRSSALWQHPAHLVMRSIETRMGAARSANTGLSMVVDPLGRVSSRTELFASAAFVADVFTTDEMTVYVRFGDVIGTLSSLVAILALGASAWKGRRTAGARWQGGRGHETRRQGAIAEDDG